MNKYRLTFIGRAVGTIGIMSAHSITIEADTPEEAGRKLYDSHEHIMNLRCVQVPEGTVYEALKAAGVPLDHHESDLYAKVTVESIAIVDMFGMCPRVFLSQIDGAKWYDIPFAYLPWWEAQQPKERKE